MKQRKRLVIALCLIVIAVFSVGYVGVLDRNDQHMLGTWTFENTPTFSNGITVTNNASVGGTATIATLAVTGDSSLTGSLTIGDEIVHEKYDSDDLTGYTGAETGANVSITTALGDIFIFSGSTPLTIKLPTITAAMDGWIWTIINRAGTGCTLTVTAPTVDCMESSKGTLDTDGTIAITFIDTIGEAYQWVADYDSGTSPTWWILSGTTTMS